jgi:hypothetical protein
MFLKSSLFSYSFLARNKAIGFDEDSIDYMAM